MTGFDERPVFPVLQFFEKGNGAMNALSGTDNRRGTLALDSLLQDIRFGVRMLFKNRAVTVFAVLALAVGIGANAALFSIIYGVLLSPLPFPDPEQLMWVETYWGETKTNVVGISSGPDYLDWERENTTFRNLAAFRPFKRFNLSGLGDPVALQGFQVTVNFFDTLKDKPILERGFALGRSFLPEESKPGKGHVIVLNHRLWQDLFGGDPGIIGKKIVLDDEPWTVIGITPPTMGFLEEMAQVFVPIVPEEEYSWNRGNHNLCVMGRLKPEATIEQAQAEFNVLTKRLEEQYVDTNKNQRVRIYPLGEILVKGARAAFLVLNGAVGFLLLISCVNVANLLLAKSGARSKEIAIRSALGAGQLRIFRQVLTESVVLALVGGLLGLLLGVWGLKTLQLFTPRLANLGNCKVPGLDDAGLNPIVLGFTAILSILTGILFGILPAWQTTKVQIHETLKESARSASSGSSRHRLLGGLVSSEVALALILLMGSGLLIKSFYLLQSENPGFNPRNVLAIQIERLHNPDTSVHQNRARFYNDVLKRFKALPGVESAAVINIHPMTPFNIHDSFYLEGRPLPPGEYLSAEYRTATEEYFQTMRIPLLKGRFFTETDDDKNKRVILVNREFVNDVLPDEEPIGKRIVMGGNLLEIIGVVGNEKLRTLNSAQFVPFVYVPVNQNSWHMVTFLIRAKGDPLALINAARREIWQVDPNQPILWSRSMEQIVGDSVSVERFSMILLTIMAGVALLLAMIGIYGVMTYAVNERRHEIGIRMALGAQVADILKLIIQKGMTLTAAGIVIGIGGSFALTRLMKSLLYQTGVTDPITFILAPAILLAVAFLACYFPAWKAAKTDPLVTLRHE